VSGPRGAGNGRDATCARTKRTARRPPARRLLGFLIGLLVPLALPAAAAAIDEFPLPTPGSCPGGITAGPDGALWFTEEGRTELGQAKIGRMTTAGVVTEFIVPVTPSATPCTDPGFVAPLDQITTGPDGALWFTMPRDNKIGRITTAGAVDPPGGYTLPVPNSQPEAIAVGPDGNLWFTELLANGIGRITTAGGPVHFPTGGIGPSDITTGPDGALWFTEAFGNAIARMTTNGAVTSRFPVAPGSGPSGIAQGTGGLWFTESNTNAIGRITTGGQVAEYPGTGAGPSAIAEGQDGALWFTESENNTIGRITSGGAITNHFPLATPFSEPSDIAKGPDGALWFTEFLGNKIGRIETAPVFNPPPPPPPVQVAKPKKKKRCKVPKVKGLSLKKAKKKLKKAKCKYRIRGKGFVVSTKPKAGKRTTKRVVVRAKPKKAKRRNAKRARVGAAVSAPVRR
jgi:virginiamycin B lyase